MQFKHKWAVGLDGNFNKCFEIWVGAQLEQVIDGSNSLNSASEHYYYMMFKMKKYTYCIVCNVNMYYVFYLFAPFPLTKYSNSRLLNGACN